MELYTRIRDSKRFQILYKTIFGKNSLGIVILAFSLFNIIQIPNFLLYVQSDDFGYIADAAFFAGYNWNPYTGDMTPYYNIGFSIFSSFIFRICNNPITIYRLLLVYIVILQNILLVIVYWIGKRHLQMDKIQSSCIAFAYSLGMLAPQNGLYYMSEVPFALCYVLVVYLLLEAQKFSKNKGKKCIITVLCAVITAYSYSVHTRFLILFVTLCVVLAMYHCFFKEKLLNYFSLLISFCIAFGATYCLVKYVQSVLYKTNVVGRVIDGNDALTRLAYISEYIKTFSNFNNWGIFIGNFLSLLCTLTLITGGLFLIFLIATIRELILEIRFVEKRDKAKFIIILSCLVSFIGMNILIAINGVTNIDELKWLTFFRYCKPFVGLLVLTGMQRIWGSNRKERLQIIKSFLFTLIVSGTTIIFYMIPRMSSAQNNSADISEVGWMQYYFYSNQNANVYLTTFFLTLVIISMAYTVLLYKGKMKKLLLTFILFSTALTCSENKFNTVVSKKNYQMIDKTLEFMQENKEKIDIPIYFMQGTYSGKLRFALFDTDMNYILSEEYLKDINFEKCILYSDYQFLFQNMANEPKYCYELDKYEYLFTSNEEIREILGNEYPQLFE